MADAVPAAFVVGFGLADTAFGEGTAEPDEEEEKDGEHLARPEYLTSGKPKMEDIETDDLGLFLFFDTGSRGFRRESSVADSEPCAEREAEGAAQPGNE